MQNWCRTVMLVKESWLLLKSLVLCDINHKSWNVIAIDFVYLIDIYRLICVRICQSFKLVFLKGFINHIHWKILIVICRSGRKSFLMIIVDLIFSQCRPFYKFQHEDDYKTYSIYFEIQQSTLYELMVHLLCAQQQSWNHHLLFLSTSYESVRYSEVGFILKLSSVKSADRFCLVPANEDAIRT